ncbi:TetR/AcrR family transcriptional regulator [Saccharomonospora sp. NB11]|jgi:AcrR family transcriptional regulator|uniref:TetR/AcrR family transcriptional regulator n=1 Tax=Saccharomonospora sp. NB11 TaxID=1642298 RepID=UPI0018D11C14|nr:TetR/AcrR family transcriptional regulator [Saccharomonospora sp. NB11]
MPAEVPRSRGVGRPPRLSLDAIVAAADRILRTDGPEKLSMRRLATELGSTPMALYHHVRDKDELLLLVMETHARRMTRPDFPDDPRERLVAAAILLHELLSEHLWIVDVLTGDDLIGPSALWIVEEMIDAAVEAGCTLDEAFHVYRAIWYYIVGDLIIRLNRTRRRARSTTPVHQNEVVANLTAGTHPRLAALADRWEDLNARDTHRWGLRAVVAGLLQSETVPDALR